MFLSPFMETACLYAKMSFYGGSSRNASGKHGHFKYTIKSDGYTTSIVVVFTRPLTNMNKALVEASSSLPLNKIRKMLIASGNANLTKHLTTEEVVRRFSLPFYDSSVTAVMDR